MKHDTEKLQDLYFEQYLRPVNAPQNGNQKQQVVSESVEDASGDEDDGKQVAKGKKKAKKKMSPKDVGAKLYNDSTDFNSHFNRLLREFDEQGADDFDSIGDTGDAEYNFDDEDSDEQVSVSKSVIKSIIDQLNELIGEGGVGDDDFVDDGDTVTGDEDGLLDDDVPLESYAFSGNGREHGAKGNYDGKAKVQNKSTLVKDNGDAEFGKQDTHFDPEDTEGSEGAHHGDQGNYDGKANKQAKSSLVGDNGNANFGKQKVGAKIGKGTDANKNYF